MQGASFDGTRISAVGADAPTSRAVPPMVLAWVPQDAQLPYAHHISVPLYATLVRLGGEGQGAGCRHWGICPCQVRLG